MEETNNKARVLWENEIGYRTQYDLYRLVEFKGKKFKLTVTFRNGDLCGFNDKCCIKVMTEEGGFINVADNKETGAPYENIYYSEKEAKQKLATECMKSMMNYILSVY